MSDSPRANLPALIFLIGYRGVGKTETARLLAERLAWSWIDADELLETRQGRSIRELFAQQGEPAFRAYEAALLEEIAQRRRCVVATGGGVVLRPENRQRLKAGWVVWLTADPATLYRRLQQDDRTGERRPNLTVGGLAEIEALLLEREPLYRECADCVVSTEGQTPAETAELIAAQLEQERPSMTNE